MTSKLKIKASELNHSENNSATFQARSLDTIYQADPEATKQPTE